MINGLYKTIYLGLILWLLVLPAVSAEEVQVYTIADSTGDWGYPAPYSHYARGPGYVRMSLIFDTLIWKDQNEFIPALAKDWEYLKDENAYKFDLRNDVTWQDGEPFTADDVIFTFDYMKDHPYLWVDESIVDHVTAPDDYTVKIYLKNQYAPFLTQVAGTLPIFPKHIYQDVTDPENFQDAKAVIGTGPYKLVDYSKSQGTYLYEANEDYYQGAPDVKQIKFVKVSEEMAGASLKKGDVDAASVKPEEVDGLKDEGFTVLEASHDWNARLMINHKKEPFSDVRFRQALAYAIDRQELVDKFLRGYGIAGNPGLFSPDNQWYNKNVEQYAYNPSKAEELITDMGYSKDGDVFTKDGKDLEVEMLVTSTNERAGELIKAQLEKVGITVNLRSVDSKTLDNAVNQWDFDLALSGHGGLGGDANILNIVISGDGFNSARYYEDEKLNQLLTDEVEEMDASKRKEIVNEIQELYANDVPALTLYYSTSFFAFDSKVKLYYTKGGVGSGVPIAMNKMAFL